jgi:LCP family protein required for cell wall assembly
MRYGSAGDDPDNWGRDRVEPGQGRNSRDWDEDYRGQAHGPGNRGPGARGPGSRGPGSRGPGSRGPRRGSAPRSSRRGRGSGHWAQFRAKSWLAQFGYVFVALTAVIAVAAGVTAYAAVYHLEGNIHSFKVKGLTGRTVYGELNILVLGSQERQGQRGFFGREVNPWTTNSDNLLLVHLDATHTHATVLSIPRDLMAYEPACQARTSQIGYGLQGPFQSTIIDGALNIGGPSCAVATVEDLTGIKLDHVIVFDFNSFRTMVDAIGGVTVCVPPGRGYHDGYSHLNLSPGLHKLTYDKALAYVRTRHGVGSGVDAGGDLPRIELQQAFISSVAQQVEHQGLLSNVSGLYKVANIATKALTVDQNLKSVSSLLHLAESLVHLKSKDINLITLPTAPDPDPAQSGRLVAQQPQDAVLYQMMRTGALWHGHLPTEPYSEVKVQVLNATGQTGLASRTATALRKLGFDVTSVGDTTGTSTTTVQFAGEQQAVGAYTLMTALKAVPAGLNTLAEPASQIGSAGTITLTLGTDFAGVNPAAVQKPAKKPGKHTGTGGTAAVTSATASGPGAVQSRNAGASICTGLPPAYSPGAQGPP